MRRRQLNKIERGITLKSIKRLKDEVEWQDYLMENCERDITKGLYLKFKSAMLNQKLNLRKLKGERDFNNEKLKICEHQIKYGVEVKQKKKNGNKSIDGRK